MTPCNGPTEPSRTDLSDSSLSTATYATRGTQFLRTRRGITIVTDHHGLGTNVMALPTGLDFHFAYGGHSASLHQREAERVGVELTVVTNSPWRFDVDEPRIWTRNGIRGGPKGPPRTTNP